MATDLGYVTRSATFEDLEVLEETKVTGSAALQSQNLGSAASGVTAVEYGEGRNHTTELTLDAGGSFIFPAITGGGATDQAVGRIIYTFPANSAIQVHAVVNAAASNSSTGNAGATKIGVGSAVATGAVTDLTGTPAFDDLQEEVTKNIGVSTAEGKGEHFVIAGASTAAYLNVAAAGAIWANADPAMYGSGKIVIHWTYLGSNA